MPWSIWRGHGGVIVLSVAPGRVMDPIEACPGGGMVGSQYLMVHLVG